MLNIKINMKHCVIKAVTLLLVTLCALPLFAEDGDDVAVVRIERLADGVLQLEYTNAISAKIYSAEYLEQMIDRSALEPVLLLDGGERIGMITDIQDPTILNKGDGEFHPFSEEHVIRALGEIACAGIRLDLDIYLLPYPRRDLPVSSTRGSEIFLSPHVRELSYEGAAYIVTHEAGHTFQNRFLPQSAIAHWDEYRRLRGITDETVYHASASHACRPIEIFAEDFRVLFGGDAARYDGSVENPDLPPPGQVAGLEAFYLTLAAVPPAGGTILSVDNYPNPFNPRTEVWIALGEGYVQSGRGITVRVYSVTGALVCELYRGVSTRRELQLEWDGRDGRGQEVGSGTYFCMVRAEEEMVTRKLLLIK